MASKQAKEIDSINKESKANSTGIGKGRTRSIFLCESEEEGFKEAKEKHKDRNGERVISTPETAKREASNKQCEWTEKSTTFLRQIHFPKEPRRVSLKKKVNNSTHQRLIKGDPFIRNVKNRPIQNVSVKPKNKK